MRTATFAADDWMRRGTMLEDKKIVSKSDFMNKLTKFNDRLLRERDQKKALEEELHLQIKKTEKLQAELELLKKEQASANSTIKELCSWVRTLTEIADEVREVRMSNFAKDHEIDALKKARENDRQESSAQLKKQEMEHVEEKSAMEENHAKQLTAEKEKFEMCLKEKDGIIDQLNKKLEDTQKASEDQINAVKEQHKYLLNKLELELQQLLEKKGAHEEKSREIFRLKLQEKQAQHDQEVAQLKQTIEELQRSRASSLWSKKMRR